MKPKRFPSLEDVDQWLENEPDEVGRHILNSWRYVLENEVDQHPIVRSDEVTVTVKLHQAEEGIKALMQSAINREDYELAQDIKELQQEFDLVDD